MSTNHSTKATAAGQSNASVLRALIVGGGVPALAAAQTLAQMGVDVRFARLQDIPSHVCFAPPGPIMDHGLPDPAVDQSGAEIDDVTTAPAIRRDHGGFRATFGDGSQSFYDFVLLAPGVSLECSPPGFPEGVELFDSRIDVESSRRVAYVMDYMHLSDPALGMSAIKTATQNVLNGGASVVCFRHVPVAHLHGETVYDEARKAGVLFVRFAEELPVISSLRDNNDTARFRLTVKDAIDWDEQVVFDCDTVVSVTRPDSSSIPQWALQTSEGNVDEQGFLLPESVHCMSGSSFVSGVFVVGEATGNLDLIAGIAQAKAAAAKAYAWGKLSRLKRGNEPLSISGACVGCLTCLRVCPHRAISVTPDQSRPSVTPWPELCRECGICASVCPSVAISLAACSDDSILAFIKEVPHTDIERTTFVFGCRRSAGVLAASISMPEHVRFLSVPCAGRVSEYVIWSALAAGAKGVLVVGCHKGNCASRTGVDWAEARIQRGLDTGLFLEGRPRLSYVTIAANEAARFERLLAEFSAEQ